MSEPLVSILTPCFNDGPTLGRALRSLVGQTMGEWECVVVDDGSGRAVRPVVEEVGDGRIRLIEFGENRGRSVARQAALDAAGGEFVAMLDADDWYYPDKLEKQVAVLRARPGLVAVSSGMAVVDEDNELVGMRGFERGVFRVFRGRGDRFPEVAFPPIMIRREAVEGVRFDPALERSEDLDFLMRVLAGRKYGVMGEALYAYQEVFGEESMQEALVGFRNQRRIFRRRLGQAPLVAGRQYVKSVIKTGIYEAARVVGGGELLWKRRNRVASSWERERFFTTKGAEGSKV